MPSPKELRQENLAVSRVLRRCERILRALRSGHAPDREDREQVEAFLREDAESYHRRREERVRAPRLRLAEHDLEPWLITWLRQEHGVARQRAFEILLGLGARNLDRERLQKALGDYVKRVRFTLQVETESLLDRGVFDHAA